MRDGDARHFCPLLKRVIFWGDCVEVNDIRDDAMDMELFGEEFSIDEANIICEQCGWNEVSDDE